MSDREATVQIVTCQANATTGWSACIDTPLPLLRTRRSCVYVSPLFPQFKIVTFYLRNLSAFFFSGYSRLQFLRGDSRGKIPQDLPPSACNSLLQAPYKQQRQRHRCHCRQHYEHHHARIYKGARRVQVFEVLGDGMRAAPCLAFNHLANPVCAPQSIAAIARRQVTVASCPCMVIQWTSICS
jgi:hypothetical protein